MLIIVHSAISDKYISSNLGVPEYSYYFVLKKYLPLLSQLGEVKIVENPADEVDEIYLAARRQNQECVYLSFTAPQNTTLGLQCPTVSVFAWEFDSLPNEIFEDDKRSDWSYVFSQISGIITHSTFTMRVLADALGEDYPMVSAPAPVWDNYSSLKITDPLNAQPASKYLILNCPLIDTRSIDLSRVEDCLYPGLSASSAPSKPKIAREVLSSGAGKRPVLPRSRWAASKQHLAAWYRESLSGLLNEKFKQLLQKTHETSGAEAAQPASFEYYEAVSTSISDRNPKVQILSPVLRGFTQPGEIELELHGIIYTTVLNPNDARKNWHDIVCAFCLAFREVSDATLIFKLTQRDSENMLLDLIHRLYQLTPFQCRVIVIDGYIDETCFTKLIEATTYIVNASHGEGQCLPLMEFMSAAIPAIAPRNTGMEDYINPDVAFIVDCSKEAARFPHDPRAAYRTRRYRINWQSLRDAFSKSYALRKEDPQGYKDMATAARAKLQSHCSVQVVKEKLNHFFQHSAVHAAMLEEPCKNLQSVSDHRSNFRDWLDRANYEARAAGWFDKESRELFTGFLIEDDDIVLDIGCGVEEATFFCAGLRVQMLICGSGRTRLTNLVNQLQKTNAFYFRAFLTEPDGAIPLANASASKIILLESLQHEIDPLTALKEAVRLGRPGARYLLSVPEGDSGLNLQTIDQSNGIKKSDNLQIYSMADFKHLVTVAGLTIERHQSLSFYWILWLYLSRVAAQGKVDSYTWPSMESEVVHQNHALDSSVQYRQSLMGLLHGAEIRQNPDDSLPKSQLIIASKPLNSNTPVK